MLVRLVAIVVVMAVVAGCTPFEGTVFELRAPQRSAQPPDPNSARLIEQHQDSPVMLSGENPENARDPLG